MAFGTEAIQNRQVEFYKDLYCTQNLKTNCNLEGKFLGHLEKKLSKTSKDTLEEDLNMSEVTKALSNMKNNKSPGQDGICVEFYKIYWNDLKEDFYDIITKGFQSKQLAHSHYRAVIKLLYKKGDRSDIRNWRPISLLNVDSLKYNRRH